MASEVGVVIPIFGREEEWAKLAARAVQSVKDQSWPCEWIYSVGGTLADARNHGAEFFKDKEWLIFLDADDELDSEYVGHMLAGTGDVRWPSTLGVYEDGSEDPFPVLLQPKQNMLLGNHMVIGSMIRQELFHEVGGFRELPILDDWDCWIRCWLMGAEFQPCSRAIYRVHVRPGSRNQQQDLHGQVYSFIQREYAPMAAAKGLM